MKYLFLTFFLFFSILTFSQKNDSLKTAGEPYIKNLFSTVPTSKYKDLVPYYDNEKWGYLDRKTKKIIIPPLFDDAKFFNPDISLYFNDETINISESGVVSSEGYGHQIFVETADPKIDTKVRSSENGFKGFIASPTGKLIAYSDLYQYNKQGIPEWNIRLFMDQKRIYGIVKNLQGQAGIIDSLGVPLKGFEFNYKQIILNDNTQDSINAWFFVRKNDSEHFSLINTKGQVKFQKEIFNYPLSSTEIFGYTPYETGDTSAIFDRYLMKWLIKPQVKIKIEGVYFSSKKHLNTDIPQNRSQAFIYYLVIEKDKRYFVDINGNKYLPK